MDSIQIKDKKFTVSIKEEDILKEVSRVAEGCDADRFRIFRLRSL